MTEAFPLQWPPGWPRTKRAETAQFTTGLAGARDGLLNELRLMGARHIVISSNMVLELYSAPEIRGRHEMEAD